MESTLPSREAVDAGAILKSCAVRFEEAFHRAARTTGIKQEHFFDIAGRRVKLTFASTALVAQLTPALEHVRAEPGAADLEVGLWEGADEPAPSLPDAWEQARYFPRGRVPGMEHPNLRLVVFPGLGSVSFVDLVSSRGWYCAAEAARVTYWESAAPLRNLLHAWLARRGAFVLHGAAIGTERGAVLLVGRGGSGKSTTSLLGVTTGMHYLGDDCCLCEMLNGQPFVHAFYNSAKVCNDALPRLNGFHARLGNPNRLPDEKAVFFLAGTHDAQLPKRLRLRAILLPQVTVDRPVSLERVSPGMALAALSPSTMMQLADADQHDLAFHAAMVKSVPAFGLSLNGDQAAILKTMKGLLE